MSYLPPSIRLISTSKEYYAYSPLVKELGEAERKGSGGDNNGQNGHCLNLRNTYHHIQSDFSHQKCIG
nr:MAG TPA: hypothetical protein [Caudoviricetes sp.]